MGRHQIRLSCGLYLKFSYSVLAIIHHPGYVFMKIFTVPVAISAALKGRDGKPTEFRLQYAADSFQHEVQKKLQFRRRSSGTVTIPFDIDIFRWVFKGRGQPLGKHWILCDKEDFARLPLADEWFFSINASRERLQILFPVRVKGTIFLRKSPGKGGLGFPLELPHIFMATEGAPL